MPDALSVGWPPAQPIMSAAHLRAALARTRSWEQHYLAGLPHPPVRATLGSLEDRLADRITGFVGSMPFVYLHSLWFVLWIVLNLGLLAAAGLGLLAPFDPFPFGLLTLIVSLEAIYLSTFVMISQNRLAQVADARAAADFAVNQQAAADVAKVAHLLDALLEHHASEEGA